MSAAVDNTLHGLSGFGLAAATMIPAVWLWWWPALSVPLVMFGWGMLREQAQHREDGWFGWFNANRLLEAGSWGIGATVAMGGWLALELLL